MLLCHFKARGFRVPVLLPGSPGSPQWAGCFQIRLSGLTQREHPHESSLCVHVCSFRSRGSWGQESVPAGTLRDLQLTKKDESHGTAFGPRRSCPSVSEYLFWGRLVGHVTGSSPGPRGGGDASTGDKCLGNEIRMRWKICLDLHL